MVPCVAFILGFISGLHWHSWLCLGDAMLAMAIGCIGLSIVARLAGLAGYDSLAHLTDLAWLDSLANAYNSGYNSA